MSVNTCIKAQVLDIFQSVIFPGMDVKNCYFNMTVQLAFHNCDVPCKELYDKTKYAKNI